jgi:hypothetical protein
VVVAVVVQPKPRVHVAAGVLLGVRGSTAGMKTTGLQSHASLAVQAGCCIACCISFDVPGWQLRQVRRL